jgi:hypothetical protein
VGVDAGAHQLPVVPMEFGLYFMEDGVRWSASFVCGSCGRRRGGVMGDVLGLAWGASCGVGGFCGLEKHLEVYMSINNQLIITQ